MSNRSNPKNDEAAHPLIDEVRFTPYDPTRYLKNEADIAAYLQVVTELGDLALINAAHNDIARARIQIDKNTGNS